MDDDCSAKFVHAARDRSTSIVAVVLRFASLPALPRRDPSTRHPRSLSGVLRFARARRGVWHSDAAPVHIANLKLHQPERAHPLPRAWGEPRPCTSRI
jgi:hypothetical protein